MVRYSGIYHLFDLKLFISFIESIYRIRNKNDFHIRVLSLLFYKRIGKFIRQSRKFQLRISMVIIIVEEEHVDQQKLLSCIDHLEYFIKNLLLMRFFTFSICISQIIKKLH